MNLLDWGDITLGTITGLVIAGIIMIILIFHLESIVGIRNAKKIHDMSEKCVVGCANKKLCTATNNLRSAGYYMFDDPNNKCVVTRWEISHIITHIFLGYFTNIYISQFISVGFELYEHYYLDCGSILDLLYNFTGFIIGHQLKNAYINSASVNNIINLPHPI
jgi:hypothetical protein